MGIDKSLEKPPIAQFDQGEKIINDLAEELADGDSVEKERLIKRSHALMEKYNDIDKVSEQIRAEKKSPFKADKFTANKGRIGATVEKESRKQIPLEDMDEMETRIETIAGNDKDKSSQLLIRAIEIYKLNGNNVDMTMKQIEDEEKNPVERKKVFIN